MQNAAAPASALDAVPALLDSKPESTLCWGGKQQRTGANKVHKVSVSVA